jgi:predicted GNAT superfamily acetyltransferase
MLVTSFEIEGPSGPEKIEIRRPRNPKEFKELVRVQLETWEMSKTEIVGHRIIRAIADNGGVVLGAFTEDGRAVGYSLAFLAEEGGKIFLYSHHTGVVPRYQGKGIGFRLKLAQREEAIRRGIDLIKWTFDPIRAGNSYFNLTKLGVISNTFLMNYYGRMNDSLNRGMRSDRLKAEWYIRSLHVEKRIHGPINVERIVNWGEEVLRIEKVGDVEIPGEPIEFPHSDVVLIKIPENLEEVRKDRLAMESWRNAMAKAFIFYFSHGYWDACFLMPYHVLIRAKKEDILSGVIL